jgi:hypothetical protein
MRLALLEVDAIHAGLFVLGAIETFGLVRSVEARLPRAPFVRALFFDDIDHSGLPMSRAIDAFRLTRKVETGKEYTAPGVRAPLANHVPHLRELVF